MLQCSFQAPKPRHVLVERGEQGIGADHELQRGREREAEPVRQQERLLPVHGHRLRLLSQLPTVVSIVSLTTIPTVPGRRTSPRDESHKSQVPVPGQHPVSARAGGGVRGGGQVEAGFFGRRWFFQLC